MSFGLRNNHLKSIAVPNTDYSGLFVDPSLSYDLNLFTNELPQGLVFSRPSAKTGFVNGQLVQYASGVPAISVANGYFGENEQRTNSIFPSVGNIFTASGTGTITAIENAGTAPDGTMTTLKINSSTALAYYFKQTSMTANGTYTCSCFIKKTASTQYFTFKQWYLGGTAVDATYNLNTATGQWVSGSGGTTYVQDCGDFWRVGICLVDTGSNNTARLAIQPSSSGVDFEVWGYQQESGAGMTSYIPSTTSAATRAADVLYATPAINATEGMLIVEYVEALAFSSGRWTRAAKLTEGTNNANTMYVYNSPVNTDMVLIASTSGVKNCEDVFGYSGVNVLTKWGMAYSPSGLSACLNGGTVYLKPVTPPVGLNRIDIANGNFCGNVRRLQIYNKRNDAKMRALTA